MTLTLSQLTPLRPGDMLAPGLVVIQELLLLVHRLHADRYQVFDPVFCEFGHGPTMEAARQDYVINLVAHYRRMNATAYVHPANARELALLQQYLLD